MDLILWRHAEAEEATAGGDDLQRRLTARGERQAKRMAQWLNRQLPHGLSIISSPARRARETAAALDRKYVVAGAVGPDASAEQLLAASGWPDGRRSVLMVGHQPALGQLAAQLMGCDSVFTIRKGAVWWFRHRRNGEPDERAPTFLLCVQTPEML